MENQSLNDTIMAGICFISAVVTVIFIIIWAYQDRDDKGED
jgi:hypothetical protein